MRNLSDGGLVGLRPAGSGRTLDSEGFTSSDVKLLQDAHQRGVARQNWGRAEFAANDFSQYLAIWDESAAEHDPPARVIARFWKTGTYALIVQGRFVANGKTLRAILPALAAGAPTTEE